MTFGVLSFGELEGAIPVELSGQVIVSALASGVLSAFSVGGDAFIQSAESGIYIDLRVANNDILLDAINEPILLSDRECIAQDIKHTIRESGLFVRLVGQRDGVVMDAILQQLELLIEEDVRLVPGTISITRTTSSQFYITADTIDFGEIDFLAVL